MPNCFQLIDRVTEHTPTLGAVDWIICIALGKACSSTRYYENWVDMLGLPLAMGKTWAEVREQWADDPYLLPVIDILEAKYDVRAWAER